MSRKRTSHGRVFACACTFAVFTACAAYAGEAPKKKRAGLLEEPPRYGVYYDRYEPSFYTGFAPRADDPRRVHPPSGPHYIDPTMFRNAPWLSYERSVRSSEKSVKLYPTPTFTWSPK